MNIDCRLLKSCTAMTAQWGLGEKGESDERGLLLEYSGMSSLILSKKTKCLRLNTDHLDHDDLGVK